METQTQAQTQAQARTQTQSASNGKKIRKPNPFLYYLICILLMPLFKFFLKTKFNRRAIKDIDGPALILCPHIANIDFILVSLALFPKRPVYVVSEHFMAMPKIKWFLQKMAVIPKKMYCTDIRTVRTIIRAKNQGHTVVLFPEGRLTCFGHSLNLTDGTAELVKRLAVDVYSITGNGAYLTLPKWSNGKLRPGKIYVDTAKLLSKDVISAMSIDEVQAALKIAMTHDEDFAMEGVSYRSKETAAGLDGILYKCPQCRAEFFMETVTTAKSRDSVSSTISPAASSTVSPADLQPVKPDEIRCGSCGFSTTLDTYYRFHGGPFSTINQWYFWQQDQLDLDSPLESEAIVATMNSQGCMDKNAGTGRFKIDRENIHFEGHVFDQPLEFTLSVKSVKAFPASVGSHFDLYYQNVMYNIRLCPDPRLAIKWVSYLDKCNNNVPTPERYKLG